MLSSGNALYDPVPVTTAQLGYYACTVEAEQYEAMLVTVSGGGVTISSTADYYGEIPIDDGSGMSAMDDHNWDVSTFLEESIGDDYANYVVTSITGTVTYSYSTFEIAPRNASDFVFAPSIQTVDALTTWTRPAEPPVHERATAKPRGAQVCMSWPNCADAAAHAAHEERTTGPISGMLLLALRPDLVVRDCPEIILESSW